MYSVLILMLLIVGCSSFSDQIYHKIQIASEIGDLEAIKKLDIPTKLITLKYACYYGRFNIVEYLINRGAIVNSDDDYPLELAITQGHVNIVKFLLNKGAHLSRQNFELAEKYDNKEMIQLLQIYHKF